MSSARRSFDKIKKYLVNPPILKPPNAGRPLILYLAIVPKALGAMLTQEDDTGITLTRKDLLSGNMGL